jgi:hypothetical protein
MIITLTILAVTYFSGRHYRKKAINNLSETGKQETQTTRRPKLLLDKAAYNEKGLKYRTLVWAIVIVGLILIASSIYFNF